MLILSEKAGEDMTENEKVLRAFKKLGLSSYKLPLKNVDIKELGKIAWKHWFTIRAALEPVDILETRSAILKAYYETDTTPINEYDKGFVDAVAYTTNHLRKQGRI